MAILVTERHVAWMRWHSAAHWLLHAQQAREIAAKLHDATAKLTMLGIAAGYEKLARQTAVRRGGPSG